MASNNEATWLLLAVLAAGTPIAYAQTPDTGKTATPDADNTRMNKADRKNAQPTVQNQSGAKADRELAAAVRKAIVRDKSLSTNAHKVKVIAKDGTVTLRGPVRSDDEKTKVSELTRQVEGVSNVDDQLLVKNTR
jgi:osmotically-inducible protein OsmY